MFQARPTLLLAGLIATSVLLGGCAAAVGGGAAATAATIYDRRTPGTLIDDEFIELQLVNALGADKELYEQTHINGTSYTRSLTFELSPPRMLSTHTRSSRVASSARESMPT